MNTRHLVLLAVLVCTAVLFVMDRSREAAIVGDALPRRPVVAPASGTPLEKQAKARPSPSIAERHMGGGSPEKVAALFATLNWSPPPPPPPPPPPQPVAPPPMAPALPFKFLGSKVDDSLEVFLLQGERILIVKQNAVIDNLYRVDNLTTSGLTVTYLPLNQQQTLVFSEVR